MRSSARSHARRGRATAPPLALLSVCLLLGCNAGGSPTTANDENDARNEPTNWTTDGPWNEYRGKPATNATIAVLEEAEARLPAGDFLDGSMMSDHSNDRRIAPLPDGVGAIDPTALATLSKARPDSIHPSVYAAVQEMLSQSGLFQIADGIYQIRGDLAYITLVRGETGWIVLDAGTTREFASAAWEFAREHLPGGADVPVSAVVYSHSHVDHFGGVKAFLTQEDVDAGRAEVIAPHGFMAEALAENVIAGSAMLRRAQYHFGANLEMQPDGSELFYLGIRNGEFTLIAPTRVLPEGPGQTTVWNVDGVTIHFKDISSAEAPAATLLYLPEHRLLFNSELMYRGLHNIYTLRGAQVRDALRWSKLINEVIEEWGDEVEIMTGPHGPNFSGNAKILEFMRLQRDNYGFIHNQAVRLINSGMKLQDVGQAIEDMVPGTLSRVWHTHGYHGTYSHNARGVVNRYIGFYDGNPANLNPLPIAPEAVKYVEYMGGSDRILEKARADFASGQYRFVATVVNKLVTAEPDNWEARHLLADAYEQLGYQAEGPQWRNAYLTAAKELRLGRVLSPDGAGAQADMLAAATVEDLLDSVAVRLSAPEAEGEELSLNLIVPDRDETWFLELSNGNLSYRRVETPREADATLRIDKSDLTRLLLGDMGAMEVMSLATGGIEGSRFALVQLVGMLERDDRSYDMVPMP